ncbi:MAG: hypothetical protein IPK93_07640 [Solirubrobacterales bacterium]|nr:hypothetical protein [Solirubrobacterales bacterium]
MPCGAAGATPPPEAGGAVVGGAVDCGGVDGAGSAGAGAAEESVPSDGPLDDAGADGSSPHTVNPYSVAAFWKSVNAVAPPVAPDSDRAFAASITSVGAAPSVGVPRSSRLWARPE